MHSKMTVPVLVARQLSSRGWMEELEDELTDMSVCIGVLMDGCIDIKKKNKSGGEKHCQ